MGARSRLVYLEGKKRKSTCLAPSPGRPYSEPRGRIVEKQGVFDEEFLNLGATDGELERLHGRPRYANAGISRLQGAKQVRKKENPTRDTAWGSKKAGDNLLSRWTHYHRPQVLIGRVRNGNGSFHLGQVTGSFGAAAATLDE